MKIAWRNLWRNRRRTVTTISAITLALLICILYSGMVEGMLVNIERDTLDFELGSVQIFAPTYQDKPSIFTRLDNADVLVQRLISKGISATARLLGAGLVAAGDSSSGAMLRGLNVEQDAQVLSLGQQIFQGEWLDPKDELGVVLGKRLAHVLNAKPGSEVVILSQASDGSMANGMFHVRGVLRSVGEATDRAGLFMNSSTFRNLMVLPTGAHQIIIKRPSNLTLAEVFTLAQQTAVGMDVQTWRQLMPTLATMVDSVRGEIMFIFFIVYIVIAIVILNAMLMAVFERIKEFGVIKALGAGPAYVLKLVFLESLLQVVIAMGVGGALSIPSLWFLTTRGIHLTTLSGVSMAGMAFNERWVAVVSLQTFLIPVVMLISIVSLAVLYPSFKAAFIRPVQAMQHQ